MLQNISCTNQNRGLPLTPSAQSNIHSIIASSETATLPDVNSTTLILSTMPLSNWRGSVTTFAGFTGTLPVQELETVAWPEISKLLAPNDPIILADKKAGQYAVPSILKSDEFVGNTREAAIRNGQPTVGKMRSKSHVKEASYVMMDLDGLSEAELYAGLELVKNDGLTYLAFTTYSHGSAEKLGMRVRIILLLDRPVNVQEYTQAWHSLDQRYFNGKAGAADASGANMYQQQGTWCCHPDRVDQAQVWRNDAGIASADILIAIGETVLAAKGIAMKPAKTTTQSHANKPINNYIHKVFPPSDANKVADACRQIGDFRKTKGAGQSEPLWFDCIGVVGICVDGTAIAQDWSSGYANYKVIEAIDKLAHRMQASATTCRQFKITNPEGCVGCTQKCKSPIMLGVKDAFSIVKTITIDNTYLINTRMQVDGIYAATKEPFEIITVGGAQ